MSNFINPTTNIVIFLNKQHIYTLIHSLSEFTKQVSIKFYINNENRYLAHIYIDEINLNNEIVEHLSNLEGIFNFHFDYNIASEFYESNIYEIEK